MGQTARVIEYTQYSYNNYSCIAFKWLANNACERVEEGEGGDIATLPAEWGQYGPGNVRTRKGSVLRETTSHKCRNYSRPYF